MKRDFSGWGVFVAGGLLALLGVYWLLAGWEHIQIERGWSQFIAGAMILSGGVVTMAIGRLIRLLAQQSRGVASALGGGTSLGSHCLSEIGTMSLCTSGPRSS